MVFGNTGVVAYDYALTQIKCVHCARRLGVGPAKEAEKGAIVYCSGETTHACM